MATAKIDHPDRRAPVEQGWHLDKKVPLSLILAMIVQVAMVITAIADIKKDVEVLKAQVVSQASRDTRQDNDMKEAMSLLRATFSELNNKLDRLIERSHK